MRHRHLCFIKLGVIEVGNYSSPLRSILSHKRKNKALSLSHMNACTQTQRTHIRKHTHFSCSTMARIVSFKKYQFKKNSCIHFEYIFLNMFWFIILFRETFLYLFRKHSQNIYVRYLCGFNEIKQQPLEAWKIFSIIWGSAERLKPGFWPVMMCWSAGSPLEASDWKKGLCDGFRFFTLPTDQLCFLFINSAPACQIYHCWPVRLLIPREAA